MPDGRGRPDLSRAWSLRHRIFAGTAADHHRRQPTMPDRGPGAPRPCPARSGHKRLRRLGARSAATDGQCPIRPRGRAFCPVTGTQGTRRSGRWWWSRPWACRRCASKSAHRPFLDRTASSLVERSIYRRPRPEIGATPLLSQNGNLAQAPCGKVHEGANLRRCPAAIDVNEMDRKRSGLLMFQDRIERSGLKVRTDLV